MLYGQWRKHNWLRLNIFKYLQWYIKFRGSACHTVFSSVSTKILSRYPKCNVSLRYSWQNSRVPHKIQHINAFSENFRSKLYENLDLLQENSSPTEMVRRLENTFNQSAVKYELTCKPHRNLENKAFLSNTAVGPFLWSRMSPKTAQNRQSTPKHKSIKYPKQRHKFIRLFDYRKC